VLRRLLIIFIIMCCILLGIGAFLMERDWVDFSTLDAYQAAKASIVLDDEGAELLSFELDKRASVTYNKIPDVLVQAFVAAEDHGFFQHHGISLKGIVRSMLVNLYHFRKVQGASTITQQLARGMFLSYERTWVRKVKEAFLAFQLERQLSKEQILELYLNNMYFGRGIYGVEAACRRFWDKTLDALTIDEAATLAAVAKSARIYSPLNAPANAKRRRDIIVQSMYNLGFISKEQRDKAIKVSLRTQDYAPGNPIRLYLQEWIRIWAESKFGKDVLYRKGLKIKTTINREMQERAEQAFRDRLYLLRQQMGSEINGGMMSLEPETGAIKVMIGGYDFRQSQFNRAFQARRQMGSSFKPIIYSLAMKAGIEMDSVFVDEPIEIPLSSGDMYRPMNWNNKFEGAMTLARALTFSCNIIAIKLFLKIGADYVVPWAKLFGITHQLMPYPSAALGTAEATVEENVAAFNVFANNGTYVKPYLIEWVKDESGNKIWEAEYQSHDVLDGRLASRMINLLSQRMILGKKQSTDGWFDADSIGKSGSTNGAATTWFVGATPSLTTAVYIGRDDNKPMGSRLLASRTAFPLLVNFYKSIPNPKKHFYRDQSLREVVINWVTGRPAENPDDPHVIVLLK
jgi:penicillin-binding protein 1A